MLGADQVRIPLLHFGGLQQAYLELLLLLLLGQGILCGIPR